MEKFKLSEDHPRIVLPDLCRKFYNLGWMAGTGGALSIKYGDEIYTTPSGVQKELVQGDDLFVQTLIGEPLSEPPPAKRLKRSTCTPLINAVYRLQKDGFYSFQKLSATDTYNPVPMRELVNRDLKRDLNTGHNDDVGAVYHLHTKSSVLASVATKGVEFKISHQKMIQAIKKGNSDKHFDYNELLVIPIVENKSTEQEIEDSLVRAMTDYPETSAILIRRHGIYVWGPSWQKVKIMLEALDFLFEVSVQMIQLGLDPSERYSPPEGAYT